VSFPLLFAGVLLTLSPVGMSLVAQLGHARAVLTATVRAVPQLNVVSAIVVVIVRPVPWTITFLAVMFTVATATSAGRMRAERRGYWAALPIAAGVIPILGVLLLTRAIQPEGLELIPVGGIPLGGAMTVTALAGQRALDALRNRRGEREAALALGLASREATILMCRDAAAKALVPALDQTRTVGLVTLPGTFVGMLLGGANPIEAGAVQVLVLIALLAAESIAITVCIEVVAAILISTENVGNQEQIQKAVRISRESRRRSPA